MYIFIVLILSLLIPQSVQSSTKRSFDQMGDPADPIGDAKRPRIGETQAPSMPSDAMDLDSPQPEVSFSQLLPELQKEILIKMDPVGAKIFAMTSKENLDLYIATIKQIQPTIPEILALFQDAQSLMVATSGFFQRVSRGFKVLRTQAQPNPPRMYTNYIEFYRSLCAFLRQQIPTQELDENCRLLFDQWIGWEHLYQHLNADQFFGILPPQVNFGSQNDLLRALNRRKNELVEMAPTAYNTELAKEHLRFIITASQLQLPQGLTIKKILAHVAPYFALELMRLTFIPERVYEHDRQLWVNKLGELIALLDPCLSLYDLILHMESDEEGLRLKRGVDLKNLSGCNRARSAFLTARFVDNLMQFTLKKKLPRNLTPARPIDKLSSFINYPGPLQERFYPYFTPEEAEYIQLMRGFKLSQPALSQHAIECFHKADRILQQRGPGAISVIDLLNLKSDAFRYDKTLEYYSDLYLNYNYSVTKYDYRCLILDKETRIALSQNNLQDLEAQITKITRIIEQADVPRIPLYLMLIELYWAQIGLLEGQQSLQTEQILFNRYRAVDHVFTRFFDESTREDASWNLLERKKPFLSTLGHEVLAERVKGTNPLLAIRHYLAVAEFRITEFEALMKKIIFFAHTTHHRDWPQKFQDRSAKYLTQMIKKYNEVLKKYKSGRKKSKQVTEEKAVRALETHVRKLSRLQRYTAACESNWIKKRDVLFLCLLSLHNDPSHAAGVFSMWSQYIRDFIKEDTYDMVKTVYTQMADELEQWPAQHNTPSLFYAGRAQLMRAKAPQLFDEADLADLEIEAQDDQREAERLQREFE